MDPIVQLIQLINTLSYVIPFKLGLLLSTADKIEVFGEAVLCNFSCLLVPF